MRARSLSVALLPPFVAAALAASASCGGGPNAAFPNGSDRPASFFPPTGAADPATASDLCPLAPVTVGEQQLRITLGGDVLFDTAMANLKPAALGILQKIKADVIDKHPDAAITVEGHTDDVGPVDYNVDLSNRRAASVAGWMAQSGVNPARITKHGYGKAFPRVPNDSAEHRQLNRRVEMVLTWGGGGPAATAASCPTVRACCELGEQGCIGKDSPGWSSTVGDLTARELDDSSGTLRLNPCVQTRSAAVWITSTDEDKISRLEESTGKEVFRVPTFGDYPQRTAVAADGSVWVTNRESGSYVHIGGDGKLLCSAPYKTCYTRAAAVDTRGFAWIGCNDTGVLMQASPDETDGTTQVKDPDGKDVTVPKCKETGRLKVEDLAPYGLVVDRNGGMWTAVSGGGKIAKIDTANRTTIMVVDPSEDPLIKQNDSCWSPYGIGIDRDGNPWYANKGCANVVKIDGQTGKVLGVFKGGPDGMQAPRALGFDREGHAWVSENSSHFVDEIAGDGTFVRKVDTSSCGQESGPLGVDSDSRGDMWVAIQEAGKVMKFKTDGTIVGCYPDNPFKNAYTYSDFTGAAMEESSSNRGVVRLRFTNDQPVKWRLVSFTGLTPASTSLCLRARTAATAAGLEAAAWSTDTCPSAPTRGTVDVTLDGKKGPTQVAPGGALEIELALTTSAAGSSPLVSDLSVAATPAGR